MRWVIRLLCVVGLLLIGGGILVGGAAVGFACFDTCPPDLARYAAIYVVGSLLPGLIVAGLGWVLGLRLFAQEQRRRRAAIVLIALPVCVIGSALALLVSNSGHLIPINEGEISRWERSLIAVIVLLPSWPLVTFLCTIGLPREVPTHVSAPRA